MFELTPAEIVGYVASAFVVASLAMSSVVRLRILSLTGSTVFLVYGTLIGSVPILITNLAIACINIWYLRLEFGRHHDLAAVPVAFDAPFLVDFLHHHLDEIRGFQPGASMPDPGPDSMVFLLVRDGLPAGVVAGRRDGTTLRIDVDYVIAAYRDSQLGQWLYSAGAAVFRNAGIDRLVTTPGGDTHRRYLQRVGFRPVDAAAGSDYELSLNPPAR